MGIHPIACPTCQEFHPWFSGNKDQRCEKCQANAMAAEYMPRRFRDISHKDCEASEAALIARCEHLERYKTDADRSLNLMAITLELAEKSLTEARAEIERLKFCPNEAWECQKEHRRLDRELASARAENERMGRLLKDLCAEWKEECETTCNSYGHDEKCKGTNLAEAKKAMRLEIERYRAALEKLANSQAWFSQLSTQEFARQALNPEVKV